MSIDYYKRYYKVKTADHNDWHISVDTTSGSDGHWSIVYEEYEPEQHLPEELFEI